VSPTELSLREAKKRGWTCAIVERWNPYAKIRQDLFGIIDILCLTSNGVVGIQATSYSNISSRVNKIADCPHLPMLRTAGVLIHVWGWRKVKGVYVLREVDCS
jgi:hypothetical protein